MRESLHDMRLGSYEDWQLRWPSTPRPVLADLVRRATGAAIERIDRIVEGYSNEVYRVRSGRGDEVIIRIRRFDDDASMSTSADEAWAIEQARGAGVPTGEVLLLDSISLDGTDVPAMVQRAVPGRPLSAIIEQLSFVQRHEVLSEVGRLMGRLGGIAVSPGDDRAVDPASGVAALRADLRGLDAVLTVTEIRVIVGLLETYEHDVGHEPTVLNHGDLSTKHIFVDENPGAGVFVSGFIDFGDWTPGPPVHDLAVLRVRNPDLEVAPIEAGYRLTGPVISQRSLDLHTLVIALGGLSFQVAELDVDGAAATTDLIKSVVQSLTTA